MPTTIYINHNGNILRETKFSLSPNNRSFRYGDGFFETMKVINGKLLLSNYHFDRLFCSLKLLRFEAPNFFTRDFLEEQIINLANKNSHQKLARVRCMIYRGDGGLYDPENHTPNFLIQSWELNPANNLLNENGLIIDVFEDAKKSYDLYSGVKSNNYLGYAMAAIWAKKQHLNDALLLNHNNRIADATIANVFIIKDGIIKTSDLSEGGINGVMRRFLLENLSKINIEVIETTLTIDEVMDADELFLTNSIYGIRWVKQFREKTYRNRTSTLIFKNLIKNK